MILERAYSIDAMLAQVTPENVHHEADLGRSVGKDFRGSS